MRCLERNKKAFYYATYQGMEKLYDGNNQFTGEYGVAYSEPVLAYGNISPATGIINTNPFGLTEGYDKILVMSDPNFPIAEDSVLWVDRGITEAHDYTVVRVARSINSVSIAIKKVDVANA